MAMRRVLFAIAALSFVACQASVQATGAGDADEPSGEAGPGSAPRIKGNGGQVTIPAGTHHGPLMVKGNGNTIQGAGAGQTIIDGDLLVKGNTNVIRGVTVTGQIAVKGNGNDVSGVEARGAVDVKGNDNKR